jgi:23S rRNA pseudouridine2605 synthase
MSENKMRLQKYISESGYTSRRNAEKLIDEGRVKVNNKPVLKQGILVSDKDTVTIDGKIIKNDEKKVYILLNKPEGYITSMQDQFDRKLVKDLLVGVTTRVYPVGRLDYNSSGLLIMTNDGEFANHITHPSSEIEKEYIVKIKGGLTDAQIKKILDGVKIDDFIANVRDLSILSQNSKNSYIDIVISEGKNREIRRIFEAIGVDVLKLKRIRIGNLMLGELKKGHFRYMTQSEVENLYHYVASS